MTETGDSALSACAIALRSVWRAIARPSGAYALVAFLAMLAVPATVEAAQRFVVIGTGGVTGVYFPAGGALCRVVNDQRRDHGIRCSVEATAGSVYNVEAIRAGDLDFAIVQSDVQYDAVRGTGAFEGRPHNDIRSLFSLHGEAFTVVARADSGVAGFSDLVGKRVNIGNPGSGQRKVMETLMAVLGWTKDSFAAATELSSREQAQALCDGRADAIVFMAGHPNASIREALVACDSLLVPVSGEKVDAFLRGSPYFEPTEIDAGLYGGSGEVPSFGVVATVVAPKSLNEEVVYAVVRSVFRDLDGVREQHAALSGLTPSAMISVGLTAPLHAGAERYYREAGLR